MGTNIRIREIPYNYTSFSDREIVLRFLGSESWDLLNELRASRKTGQSARMLFEILGDLWIVSRNPFLQEDLLEKNSRLEHFLEVMNQRIHQILERSEGNTHVHRLVAAARHAVDDFAAWFPHCRHFREQILKTLKTLTLEDNIDFSGLARVAHVTDATDWRVEYPFVVITPENEGETAPIVAACIELGLTMIPRGGGTGYTGSGVPLHQNTAIINMEKLRAIQPVVREILPGCETYATTMRVEAGAVTEHVAQAATRHGYLFAVDPTSRHACTIGGNIAMNAGGKKAVLWGTTLDNLVSWRMVTPAGGWLQVERLSHNRGKIHDQPQAYFRVSHLAADGVAIVGTPEVITLNAGEIRRPGLGKDVTNKYLGGLPGVQKEGCDGLITSAVFLVHDIPRHTYTVCLEFFGHDIARAVPAIVEIKNYLDQHAHVGCAGLEHMDERYVRAVGYNAKASRGERPKMVLLADVVGDDENQVSEAATHVVGLAQARAGEGFIAITEAGRKRFWADRSRTAAIAAHTNAFKINEDVVIPLEKLAEYSDGIERINIEQSVRNKLLTIQEMQVFLLTPDFKKLLPSSFPTSREGQIIIESKLAAANLLLEHVHDRWSALLHGLDHPASAAHLPLTDTERRAINGGEDLVRLLLRQEVRVSFREEVARPLKNIFSGDLWQEVTNRLDTIYNQQRANRLFIALHMHAGDGNVHTNIPVNSNDYAMLGEAHHMVTKIMALAKQLGGRISGEHGIGLTKFLYLDPDVIDAFCAYKQKVDPNGHFNRGKLLPGSGLENAYTPSLRLVQQEALILRESAMGALNDDVRNCLRCGKCKPVCSTHVPTANLLYSPRNKILAVGLAIEAFLYEEQTKRGISASHWQQLGGLADHCTTCHLCCTPCPVHIDFGRVTIRLREMLKTNGRKKDALTSRMAMAFLTATDPRMIRLASQTLIHWGYVAQRLAYDIKHRLSWRKPLARPCATRDHADYWRQICALLDAPLPRHRGGQTTRAILGLGAEEKAIPLVVLPDQSSEERETVFYFPGCGGERLFHDIALASLAMLHHMGIQTAMPPGYLCCGYPQASAGDHQTSRRITMENRVLLHRVANSLNYLHIKTVVVSCGTCLTQLEGYHFDIIFPGCRILDIHEFLMEKGLRLEDNQPTTWLFHDPCHSPMKVYPPGQVATTLLGSPVRLTDRCCGEAGTFALSHPEIANQVRHGKKASIRAAINQQTQETPSPVRILTSCPSCYQGLSRYRPEMAAGVEFLVVDLARRLLGENWRREFTEKIKHHGLERVVF